MMDKETASGISWVRLMAWGTLGRLIRNRSCVLFAFTFGILWLVLSWQQGQKLGMLSVMKPWPFGAYSCRVMEQRLRMPLKTAIWPPEHLNESVLLSSVAYCVLDGLTFWTRAVGCWSILYACVWCDHCPFVCIFQQLLSAVLNSTSSPFNDSMLKLLCHLQRENDCQRQSVIC